MRTSPERGVFFYFVFFFCANVVLKGGCGGQGWRYLTHEQKGFKILSPAMIPSILILFAGIVPYLNDFVSFSLFSF